MTEENNMTFAQAFGGSRDMCCIAAVGDMAKMGRFDEEFRVYGCACCEKGQITYRVSPVADQIYDFVLNSAYEARCPTMVHVHTESMPVPVGMRERLARRVKLHLARKLQAMYPALFFECLAVFGQTPAQNGGVSLLEALREQIEGHFDKLECQLLEGTMQLVAEAKQVDHVHVMQLRQWLQKMRRQMEDDPKIQRGVARTFYGFCAVRADGTVKTIVNAQALPVREQHVSIQQRGLIVGPILQQEQWFEDAMAISDGRQQFRQRLQSLQNTAYFDSLNRFRTLPSVVAPEAFAEALKKIEATGQEQAIADFRGYGYRWHCL